MTILRSLEIFSGAGGLAKGLELAGFEHSALVEFNKHACSSLKANFDPSKVFEGDIRRFPLSDVATVDVVAGGPPCQPFSLGGKHKAHEDQRDMFPYAIRAIEKLEPKAFIFENVKGLLRATFAEYFEYIILRLTYPGCPAHEGQEWLSHLDVLRQINPKIYSGTRYNVSYQLINAADYGVPQTRERVIIVGVRSDLGLKWKFPKATHSMDRLLWEMHISGDYWRKHNVSQLERQQALLESATTETVDRIRRQYGMFAPEGLPWQTVRDALKGLPDPMHINLPDHDFKGGARTYPGHTGSYIDWPSKTIKAGAHGVPGGENMIRFADGTVRYFTVLEAKRIQTFPDGFHVHGAWGEAMRQLGNAVPVSFAKIIGTALVDLLNQESGRLTAAA